MKPTTPSTSGWWGWMVVVIVCVVVVIVCVVVVVVCVVVVVVDSCRVVCVVVVVLSGFEWF